MAATGIIHLWIFRTDGTCLVDYCFAKKCDDNPDPTLFGGFVNAIKGVGAQLGGADRGHLSAFKLAGRDYYLFQSRGDDLFLVVQSNITKRKKLRKKIELIDSRFNARFPRLFFEQWDGALAAFFPFQEDVEALFVPDPMGKLQASLWD